MEDKRKALSLLFDRPKEPLFLGKGEDAVIFDIPDSFIAERFRSVSNTIKSRMKRSENPKMKIDVNEQEFKLPDIKSFTDGLPRDKSFSLWLPRHAEIAGNLIKLFVETPKVDDLLTMAVYLRDEINTELFNYSLSVALLHRKDTRGVKIPSLIETFPYKFLHPNIIQRAKRDLNILPSNFRSPIIVPVNKISPLDDEQKLWYFREDVGVNLHHWHWHLVYPHTTTVVELIDKDRRGELFYYMHLQIMARYNSERISNGMKKVENFSDFGAAIHDGYSPKLSTLVANRSWPSRPDDTVPASVIREAEEVRIDINEMNVFLERFKEVVEKGFVVTVENEELPLDEYYGIDILGNLMESTILSPNLLFYGNLHNHMHLLISYSHDPKNVQLAELGIIGDATTAMRDPTFYRIHAYIDELFQLFKAKLPPYTTEFLSFPGINVVSIETQTLHLNKPAKNQLFTFWQQSDVNLSRGLDFSPRGDVFARITHLQHSQFTYKLIVNNSTTAKMGTVRIFLSSKYGFDGENLSFNQQRLLMMELDRFVVQSKFYFIILSLSNIGFDLISTFIL
jgi:tyrosinase